MAVEKNGQANESKAGHSNGTEQASDQTSALLRAVLHAQGGGFLYVADRTVRYIGPIASKMLGLSVEGYTCMPVSSLALPALATLCAAAATSPQEGFNADITVPATGLSVELLVRGVDGETGGVVVLLRDSRREHELDRMKADFVSAVSHELRTPLTSILGYSSLLLDAGDSIEAEDRRLFLQTIEAQGRVLLELINDLIEISKLEADTLAFDYHVADPAAIAQAVVEQFTGTAEAAGIRLTADVDGATLPVECDPVRIRQALGYLLDNALKFTETGGSVVVRVRDAGDCLCWEVQDTGIGIAPENHCHLFEKFYQTDSSATRKANGTGLGLAIVKRIVEIHGGEVRVESELGRGSTFGFLIPACPQAHREAA